MYDWLPKKLFFIKINVLSFSLDNEIPLPADDFLQALSSELEIPLLLGGEGSPRYDESPDEIIKGATLDSSFGDYSNIDNYDLNCVDFDDVFNNVCGGKRHYAFCTNVELPRHAFSGVSRILSLTCPP